MVVAGELPGAARSRARTRSTCPAGQPIAIRLTSDNVIHSFWVPQLAGKEDAVPGQVNQLRFTADDVGTYIGQCAEYCGIQHAHMSIRVHVLSPGDFGRWLARAATAAGRARVRVDRERSGRVPARSVRRMPHGERHRRATGTIGPNLSDVGARSTLGAGAIENNTDEPRTLDS